MGKLFSNMKIQKKLLVGFSSCILISMVLGVIGIWSMKNINDKYTYLLSGPVTGAQKCEEMGNEYANARRNLILAALIGEYTQEVQDALKSFDDSIAKTNELLEWQMNAVQMDPLFDTDPKATEALEGMKALQAMITVDYVGIKNEVEAEIKAGNADRDNLRAIITEKGAPIANTINEIINMLVFETQTAVSERSGETAKEVDFNILVISVLVVLIIISTMISSLLIGRAIRKPIHRLRNAAHKI